MEQEQRHFLEYLELERHYSEKTITNYDLDITKFITFCKEHNIKNYHQIDYQFIRTYINYLYEEKYSNKTLCRHMSTLRSFFKYLVSRQKIDTNPFLLISSPKKEQRLPNYLFNKELEQILATPNQKTPLGKRNALILEMFYATGIRLSELTSIQIKDIDFSNWQIRILGKGNKERYVLYGKNCKELLENYLKEGRNNLLKEKNDYLFLNSHGKPLTPSGIEYLVKKITRESGVTNHVTPHVFRHTFATHMLNEGADLVSVQELLGHSDLATTSIYTHVSNERLRKVYLDTHPRAKK